MRINCFWCAAVIVAPSIAFSGNVKESPLAPTENYSVAPTNKTNTNAMADTITDVQEYNHVNPPVSRDLKEYLSECRDLIKTKVKETRTLGKKCYQDKLEALINSSESYQINPGLSGNY
jgi:hypothetical protein